jgi:NADH-quinone oxidoreductase subunit N
VVSVLARDGREYDAIDTSRAWCERARSSRWCMSICMFSLLGMPAAGFVGKFLLFSSAVQQGLAAGNTSLVWLVVIAVLNSALSRYYLRWSRSCSSSRRAAMQPSDPGSFERIVLVSCVAGVLLLGVMPQDALPWVVSLVNLPDERAAARRGRGGIALERRP